MRRELAVGGLMEKASGCKKVVGGDSLRALAAERYCEKLWRIVMAIEKSRGEKQY